MITEEYQLSCINFHLQSLHNASSHLETKINMIKDNSRGTVWFAFYCDQICIQV